MKGKIILSGEEAYIMHLELPKACRHEIWQMVKDELGIRFRNTEDILFDFALCRKDSNKYSVVVYCIKKKLNYEGVKLKGVYPLQFYVLKKYIHKIKEMNCCLLFFYANKLYLINLEKGIMVTNSISDYSDGLMHTDFCSVPGEIRTIYHINISKDLLDSLSAENLKFVDLGMFGKEFI
jgi:hypothetical protein